MFYSVRKIALAALTGVAGTLVSAGDCQAGPFLDWLFGRPVLVYPSQQVVAYPTVAAPAYAAPMAAVQTTNYAPSYPTVVNYPNYPVAPVAPVGQPVVVGYAPTYRTNWLRVPVTYYRPVTNYTVTGYPAVGAVPCNTYGWQAQRVPTVVQRPWIPFVPTYGQAPVTYGYAPVPSAVSIAPVAPAAVAPACQCQLTNPAAATPYYGSAPAIGAPSVGVQSGSSFQNETAPVPASGIAPAADEAPSLLPGSFPASPALQQATPGTDFGSGTAPATIQVPTGSASVRQQTNSPYRVTPIPAPDVRTFDSQRKTPAAPPLLQGRERTVSNAVGQTTVVENASWMTAKPAPQAQAAPAPSTNAKPLWKDGGWRN